MYAHVYVPTGTHSYIVTARERESIVIVATEEVVASQQRRQVRERERMHAQRKSEIEGRGSEWVETARERKSHTRGSLASHVPAHPLQPCR